jgi:hypothetical protein
VSDISPVPGSAGTGPAGRMKKVARRRWPTALMVAISLAGIIVAAVAWNVPVTGTRMTTAVIGFGLVIGVGTAMLFVQRVLDVGVARSSGSPLLSSFDLLDRLAFGLLVVASVANGIVIALQVARQ